jgi:outer membrane protein assembly factor BamB
MATEVTPKVKIAKFVPLILSLLVDWCLSSACARSEDWSAWRGTRGDGISQESSAPLHWSSTENVRWRTPIQGVGRSSPIIVGQAVYLTTFLPQSLERQLVRLDRKSGEVQWTTTIHRGEIENQHRFNTSASATPTSDGQHVFVVFVDSNNMVVASVDFDGEICWKRDLGAFTSKHGFAASPILCEEGLLVNGHQDGDAFVSLMNKETGETKWSYHPETKIRSFSTPVLAEVDGQKQIVVAGSNETLGLDPTSGHRIWYVKGPTEKVVCTPSVGHGQIFSFGGSPEKRAFAIRLGGKGDISDSHVAWQKERGMPYVPSPLLYGNFLHVIDDLGVYTCIDPATGDILKNIRKGGNTYSSPIGVAGRVYLFDDSGLCTVISNDSQFEVLAKNNIGELVQTTPALSDGQLFVRSEFHLWCLEE